MESGLDSCTGCHEIFQRNITNHDRLQSHCFQERVKTLALSVYQQSVKQHLSIGGGNQHEQS